MNVTTPIRTDRDEAIDEWIDVLRSDQETWGAKTDAVTRATLRIMGRSDTEYTMTTLWEVFSDRERREAFLHAEQTDDEPQASDLDSLRIEDDALFNGLARRTRRFVEEPAN